MSSFTRQQLEAWLKTIDVRAERVLDVGGAQKPVKGRTKSWEVKDYEILDLEQPHEGEKPDYIVDIQDYSHMCDLRIDYRVENFNDIDMVFCLEVAEYWHNPFSALRNINWFLKQDGILYISFPFIYPHHNPEGQDYLRYTKWGVEKLLKETGFEIEYIKPRKAKYKQFLLSLFSSEGMRPSKNFNDHDDVGYLVKAIKK